MKAVITAVFALGLVAIGLIGTGTYMLFQWPGYFLLGVAGVLGIFAWRSDVKFGPNDLCLLSAMLLGGYVVARALTSPVVYLAREDLLLVLACLIVYSLTAVVLTRTEWRVVLLFVFVGLGMVSFVIGLHHFAGHPEFSILPGYKRTYPAGRVGGLFNNPNHLAAAMSFVSLLAWNVVLLGKGGAARKLILLFCTAMMVVTLILTVSRGGMIGFAVGVSASALLTLWVARYLYQGVFKKVAVGAGVLIVGAVAAVVILMSVILETRFSGGDLSSGGNRRMHLAKAAIEQFALSPAFGTGSRTYYYYCRLFRPEAMGPITAEIEHTHNDFAEFLAEYGAVGALILAVFLVAHAASGLRYIRWFCRERFRKTGRRTGGPLALTLGCMSGLAALAAHAFFDFHMHIPAVAVLAAFGFGVLANPGGRASGFRNVRIKGVRPVLAVGTVAAGSFLVFRFFTFGVSEYQLEEALRMSRGGLELESIARYRKAKALDPENHRIFFSAGISWLTSMREDMPEALKESILRKAAAELEEAYKLFPQDIYILIAYGNCLDGLLRSDVAEARFLDGLKWAPKYRKTRLAYAIHLYRVGRFEEAEEALGSAWKGHQMAFQESREMLVELQGKLAEERKKREAPDPVPLSEPLLDDPQ